jgi:hypothetical protein
MLALCRLALGDSEEAKRQFAEAGGASTRRIVGKKVSAVEGCVAPPPPLPYCCPYPCP